MATKIKSIAKHFMATLCIAFVFCVALGVGIFNIYKPSNKDNTQPTVNNLTLNSGFSDNQYIVVNGKVYNYTTSANVVSLSTNSGLQFNADNTLELIFLKDSISELSSFSFDDTNIASVLQAEKTEDNININILYSSSTANITTSLDADYTLGTLALNTNSVVNYTDGEFTIGTTKGSTSLLATKAETQILNFSGGTLTLGNSTYTAKSAGRAINQTGGTLNLNNITLTGFTTTENGGAIYKSAGTLTLTDCTLTNNTAANGGAIYTAGNTTITGGTYTGNTTTSQGGAIYSTGTTKISSATISNNTTTNGGGCLVQYGGTAELTNVTMQDNITTTSYGHAFYVDNGAVITVNSGTYATQNSSYTAATVIAGNATINLVGGTFKGYNYAFDSYSANGANANYVLKGNPTIEATSGNHFWLNSATYLRVETNLTKAYTVVKSGVTSFDDGDAATSYVAYSTNSTYLNSAKTYITVTNYQTYHQNSTAMKTNYVVCEYKSYTATFNGNGGSNGTSITKKYKAALGTLPTSTRTGYTFNGWYTATSGGTQISSTTTMPANNVTYYAHWTANTYTVVFNKNNLSATGTMSNQTHTYDTNLALTANAFSLTGYSFSGWATSASGSVDYTDKQSVKNLSSTQGATVNLYAKWTANTYTVVFNKNNTSATGTMSNQTHTYDTNLALTANAFSLTGYSFSGWATSASGSVVYTDKQSVKNLSSTQGATVNLYAKWTANIYKVTLNNQSATTAGTTEYYYQFNTTKVINGVTCYYFTTSALTTGLANGSRITCPTRTGYAFGGYYTSTGGSGTQYIDASGQCINNLYASTSVAKDITLYAKWTANTYTVVFNKNNTSATGTMSNQTHTYDTSLALTANAFSLTGYSFSGWATSASGSVVYTDKQSVKNLSSTQGATVNLYAKWTLKYYTVTFSVSPSGYGTVSRTYLSVPHGSTISTNSNTVTIDGTTITATPAATISYVYSFTSWSNATGTVTDDRTITANFSRRECTVNNGQTLYIHDLTAGSTINGYVTYYAHPDWHNTEWWYDTVTYTLNVSGNIGYGSSPQGDQDWGEGYVSYGYSIGVYNGYLTFDVSFGGGNLMEPGTSSFYDMFLDYATLTITSIRIAKISTMDLFTGGLGSYANLETDFYSVGGVDYADAVLDNASSGGLTTANLKLGEQQVIAYVERKEDDDQKLDIILDKHDYDTDTPPTTNQTTSV